MISSGFVLQVAQEVDEDVIGGGEEEEEEEKGVGGEDGDGLEDAVGEPLARCGFPPCFLSANALEWLQRWRKGWLRATMPAAKAMPMTLDSCLWSCKRRPRR
jgi:hypothetical protein